LGKLEQDFAAYRARMNERVLAEDNRVIKRIYSVDSLAYGEEGALRSRPRNCSASSLVGPALRRLREVHMSNHMPPSQPQGDRRGDEHRLVVGGTIVIPHLRRAVEFLDDLEAPQS